MQKRFLALDAFRGISALCVVLFHLHILGSVTELKIFRGSELLVEFFFVLSGFVLAHGYGYKTNLSFLPFLKSRIWRLYPLHLVMLGVFIFLESGKLVAFTFLNLNFNDVPFTGTNALQEIIPNLLLLQSWTPHFDRLSFNYPSWSISIEFYMYLMLFASITLFSNIKQPLWGLISICMLALLASQTFLFETVVIKGLSCFFGGAFTYAVYRKIQNLKIPFVIGSIFEIVMLILVILTIQYSFESKEVISVILFSFVVLLFAFESGYLSKLFHLSIFQITGKLSYSIYMTHAALLFCIQAVLMVLEKLTGHTFTAMIGNQRYLDFGSVAINNVMVGVILLTVIALSFITYHYIEMKALSFSKKNNDTTADKHIISNER